MVAQPLVGRAETFAWESHSAAPFSKDADPKEDRRSFEGRGRRWAVIAGRDCRRNVSVWRTRLAEVYEVADDFPELSLSSATCVLRAVPHDQRAHLEHLGDRVGAIATGALRTDPVASAYRSFARQIGLDPDVERNPLDEAAVHRLRSGGFTARGPVESALLVAMLETFVPLWALDGAAVSGPLRIAVDDDDRLVVRDDVQELAPLMCPALARPHKRCSHVVVYALRVRGVPDAIVDEALWHVRGGLE
jgi:hypothetical protein